MTSQLFSDQTFADFGLPEPLALGIAETGFVRLTRIQAETLPLSLVGRDVAAQSQTGTGKTAAFLISIFARLMRDATRAAGVPGALVVAPTRELAVQIRDEAEVLGRHCGLTTAAVFGGIDYQGQAQRLSRGVDVVIGTPGRLIDFLRTGVLDVGAVKMLVIDEADRMFDMGFIKDIRFLLRRLPKAGIRQSMLFSATLSPRVLELAYEHMNDAVKVEVSPDQVTAHHAEQVLYHVSKEEKLGLLLGLLMREQPTRTLVFVNTKAEAAKLTFKLSHNGFPAELLTADLSQKDRLRLVERFKRGEVPIVVASDVASRGIHVEGISHVFNYDLPQDPEDYVHRIGRTARVGEVGKAVSLACEEFVFSLEAIEQLIGERIRVEWPDETLVRPDRAPHYVRPRRPGDASTRRGGSGRGGPDRGPRRAGARSGPSERRRGPPDRAVGPTVIPVSRQETAAHESSADPSAGSGERRGRHRRPVNSAEPSKPEGAAATAPSTPTSIESGPDGESITHRRRPRRRRSSGPKPPQGGDT
ncbi:MAG: DEAD/DEAH box helicase [Deltaproteobacteria bacterium]|nr:DEAD/DEAH box helicase [Deltaproteobacteria bacterium]